MHRVYLAIHLAIRVEEVDAPPNDSLSGSREIADSQWRFGRETYDEGDAFAAEESVHRDTR